MWLITGPFESEHLGDEVSQKTKLLKTNRVYGVGRHKDSALSINNKKVSRQNGEFMVGEHTIDDVSNSSLVPTLSLRNNKTVAMKVSRGDDAFIVNPDSTYGLETGDIVRLASNVNATVKWDPKICFYALSDSVPVFDLVACASIGLKLTTKHTRDVTHHLISNITAPLAPSVFLSLLTPAWFVNPQWLLDLIHRGNDETGLQRTYDPPQESNYGPLIDTVVAERNQLMARESSWRPNEARKTLFDGIRFICVVLGNGTGSLTKAMADIVSRGGAERQLINVEREAEEQVKGAAGVWGAVLKKRKIVLKEGMRSGLVLVGEEETLTAHGIPRDIKKGWGIMVEKARSVNMRVIHPSLIGEAIFTVDVSGLDCVLAGHVDAEASVDHSSGKPLADFIPSTHPEEPSQLSSTAATRLIRKIDADAGTQRESPVSQISGAGPSRRLTRRATSQTPAPEAAPPAASTDVDQEQSTVPKKLLKRRAKTGGLVNQLLGFDDTTILDDSQSLHDQSQSAPPESDRMPPTPARPGRLKRRAGTAAIGSQPYLELSSMPLEVGEEPPLKKFKALFEESGQGCVTDQTDPKLSGEGNGGVTGNSLAAVREEEEPFQTQEQSGKRKAIILEEAEEAEGDADVEMQNTESSFTAKRRTIEAASPAERPQEPDSQPMTKSIPRATTTFKSSATKGATHGNPDTDPSFLRAIASNKRGKKTEDDFDREFNQLRISKPDINNANGATNMVDTAVQWAQEWDGLDEFEKDVGIRGNFMQIVELKVWKNARDDQPGRNTRRESGLGSRLDWNGREDFKKFRRKMNLEPREAVHLIVSGPQDYEPEEPFFDIRASKKGRGFDHVTESQGQSSSQPVFTQTPSAPISRPKSQAKPKHKPSSVDEEVDEDDEVEKVVGGAGTQGKGKSLAPAKGRASQTAKKPQPLFDLDEEEEAEVGVDIDETLDNVDDFSGLTLRSAKGTTQRQNDKPRTRGMKRKMTLQDSDSDDGLTFGGFSKKAKKRK